MTKATAPRDARFGRNWAISGQIALAVVVLALAFEAAALMSGFDAVAWVSNRPPERSPGNPVLSFDDRFAPGTESQSVVIEKPRVLPAPVPPPERIAGYEEAKDRLTKELQAQDWRAATMMLEPKPAQPATEAVPLPRSRPAETTLALQSTGSLESQGDNRTLLQKLSDLLPSGIKLASLAPDGGLGDAPDLKSLGYDSRTAVYDISARAVYLPNGSKLEAHSGLGDRMDDPAHVDEQNVGATPPNIYELRPRERLFHGVQALRMIPVGGSTLGRSGLLAHNYMLGPSGDSNGCVSIKNYDAFLSAYQSGEIKRLLVVPSLNDRNSVSRVAASPS